MADRPGRLRRLRAARCALLAKCDTPVDEVGVRVERLYDGLREGGLAANDATQLASHLLWFSPVPDAEALRRFFALHAGFRAADIRMWSCDFDELATLALLDHDVATIVDRVVEHRAAIEAIKPKPEPVESFSLACSTTFLELVSLTRELKAIEDARGMMSVRAAIDAQQASTIVASTAAITTVVIATSAN